MFSTLYVVAYHENLEHRTAVLQIHAEGEDPYVLLGVSMTPQMSLF